MGLDIYLYTAAQAAQNAAYDKASEDLYSDGPDGKSPRDKMTDDEYRAWSAQWSHSARVDVPSTTDPEHYCNRRYLRSSYNSGGFNRVVGQTLGEDRDFYWIFEPMGRNWPGGEDEEPFTEKDIPAFEECRKRASSVAEDLSAAEPFAAMTISHNIFRGIRDVTDAEALVKYRQELARDASFGWYSNSLGMFFRSDPPTVVAAVPGVDALKSPAVHLIYRRSDLDYYVNAARIAAEFCDEAIGLIRADGSCQMSWSG